MIEVIAVLACAMAVFYYLSWRKVQGDSDAMFDAIMRIAKGEAVVTIKDGRVEIKDKNP